MPDSPKDLLNRFYEAVNAGDLDALDVLLADDVVEHESFPGIEPNKEGIKQVFAMFRSAFPNLRMEAHELIAEGGLVCARVTTTGTQDGEFMGMPPSGKQVEVEMIDIVRVADGQVVEHWGVMDSMTMMQQLGAMPEEAPV